MTVQKGSHTIRVYEHIDEIDPVEWDALIGPDDLQASHRFVQVCQHAGVENAAFRHVMVYRDNMLQACATFSKMHASLELLSPAPFRASVQRVRRLFPGFLRVPVLFCGLPVSFGQSCVRFHEQADRAAIVQALAGVMETLGLELGAAILCFKEFSDPESETLDALRETGYFRAPSLPFCTMPVRWGTFEAYLGSMRAGYRRQVKADLHVREQQGLQVRLVEDYAPEIDVLYALYEQVMDRAEFQLEHLNQRFFEVLQARMGAQSRALLIECRQEVVAAAILLYSPNVLTFLLAGINYRLNQACQGYQNLLIEMVAEAIRSGSTVLSLGQTSYAVKGRMGAETEPRYLYVRHTTNWCHRLLRAASRLLFPVVKHPPRHVFKSTFPIERRTASCKPRTAGLRFRDPG